MMIKKELKSLCISKSLLCLLAMFMMLLAPQRAWADGLGLTIAGVTVTSENASDIASVTNNIQAFDGKNPCVVSYSNGVLTLQNARIEGSGCFIEWSNNSDLTIEFSGYNSIDNQDWEVGAISAIKSTTTGHKLILKKKEGATEASLSLGSTLKGTDNADLSDVAIISGFTGGVSATGLVSSENSGSNSSSPVYTNKTITYTYTAPTDYNLLINEIQVTSENFNNITGTGIYSEANSVSYNPTTKTLTLNGASINGSIKRTNNTDLTIHLVGDNSIIWNESDNIFIGTGGALTITTDETTPGSLYIGGTSKWSDFVNGFNTTKSTPIWHDQVDDDIAITYGWYLDQGCAYMTLKTNNPYDLWIKESTWNDSVQFCDALLSYYGGVTFEPVSSTLSLREHSEDEQSFSPYSFTSKLSALTVSVSGDVTMNSFHYVPKTDGQQGTLTIEKFNYSSADVNALTLSDDDGVITGFSNVTIKNPFYVSSPADFTGSWTTSVKSATISTANSYDIWIGETQVTDANKNNLGDNKVSFTASVGVDTAPIYTLTLNGATLTAPVIVGLSNLTIDIQGTNSITSSETCIQKRNANINPELTFKSTSDEVGSLTLTNTGDSGNGVISSDYSGKFSISNELALILLRNGDYTSNTYYFTAGEVHNAQLVPSYGVQVNDMQVYEGNATNVLGDNKVSFDKSSHTLTLNNVSGIEAISTTLSTLDIDLVGNNSLYRSSDGSIFESASGENVTINLKSTGATKGSLTMQTGENSSATFKGNNVTLTADNSLALLSGNLADNKGTLVYGVNYDLWISGTRVTSANASNIWGEGTDFEFDAKNSVLYYRSGGSTSYPVLSGLPNLTIKIGSPDNEGLYSKNNIGIIKFGAPQGVTITATSGTLTISKILDNTQTVQKFDIVGSGDESSLIQGFSSVTYSDFVPMADGITYNETSNKLIDANGNGWNETTTFVTSNGISIPAPTMSKEAIAGADGISLKLSTNMYGTIKYSVNYEDTNETDITDATYDSENKPVISKPATVTAYATINGHNSTTTKGKYFDSNPNPFRLIYGADPIDLVLEPAIDESDGISITGIEANVTYNTSTEKISSSTMGSFGGPVAMSSTDGKTVILNNYFTMSFEVVPPAPTITLASDTYYSTHDPIEITAPELPETLGAKIMYKWNNKDAQEYEEAIPIETGTLTAWVECTLEGQDAPVVSDEVTATYTIVNPTLVVNDGTFHNGWATYYNANEALELPEGVGAFVASGVNSGAVSVMQISSIPKGVPVLLSNVAANLSNTTEYVANTTPNLLKHADTAVEVDPEAGDYYGLYDGTFMRVKGTISAGKNYLLNPAAIQGGFAPQLTIVIDGETTGVNDVRSKKEDVRGDIYDLQGRKVKKPSKKGLYIQKGHKVVVNK